MYVKRVGGIRYTVSILVIKFQTTLIDIEVLGRNSFYPFLESLGCLELVNKKSEFLKKLSFM